MEMVWILTEYEWDSYSYSGITPCDFYIHATREGAEANAKDRGLTIVDVGAVCSSHHATLESRFILA